MRTYEEAVARIETILAELDTATVGLRNTLDLIREGSELVRWCDNELTAVAGELEELRLDELAKEKRDG